MNGPRHERETPQHQAHENDQSTTSRLPSEAQDTAAPSANVEVAVSAPLPRRQRRAQAPTGASSSTAAGASSSAAAAGFAAADEEHSAAASALESAGRAAAVSEAVTGSRSRVSQVFITRTGSKYHLDPVCRGLRNAREVIPAPVCQGCGSRFVAVGDLWAQAFKFEPCKICAL